MLGAKLELAAVPAALIAITIATYNYAKCMCMVS